MKTLKENWILLLAIAAIAGGAYYIYSKKDKEPKTQKELASYIIENGCYAKTLEELLTFEEAFIIQWQRACAAKKPTFSYAGKIYNTKGGRAA